MIFGGVGIGRLFEIISGIHIRYRRLAEEKLRHHGITYPQMGVLLAVSKAASAMSQTELAGTLETDTTTITVICDSLEKKKLILRSPNPVDRRSKVISLTPAGNRTFAKAFSDMSVYMERLESAIPPNILEAVIPVLEKIYLEVSHGTGA